MTSTADFNDLPAGNSKKPNGESALNRLGNRFIGLCVIAASLLTCVALASWNVDDPSFTHATDHSVTNILGFPGASLSDLLFQFFGVAAAVLLLPAIWGWQMIRLRLFTVSAKQGFCFGGLILLGCGIAACLPVPETWPMPTGLGGIIGNGLLALPASLLGKTLTNETSLIGAALFALPVPVLIFKAFFAAGTAQKSEAAPEKKRHMKIGGDELETEERGESVILPMIMGAAAHSFYFAGAKLRHLFASRSKKIRREYVPEHDLTMEDAPRLKRRPRALSALSTLKRKLIDEPIADDGLGDYLDHMDDEERGLDKPFPKRAIHMDASARPGIAHEPKRRPDPDDATGKAASTPMRISNAADPLQPGNRARAEIQPKLPAFKDAEDFELPPLHLLTEAPQSAGNHGLSPEALAHNAELLEGVLDDFGVKGEIVHVRPGPVVTLYELEPAPGIKSSRVIGLADDIARSMSAIAARVAVIPGKNAIGIELPNAKRETVYLHESIASKTFETSKGKLPICLGKTIGGESVIADLARMPHLLVAGTTGSGKSVAINTMILSLLFRLTPEECKLIMIDPKMLELSIYDGIPHLLTPVVTDPKKAVVALKWTVREMEERYRKMSKVGVRNIDGFNTRVKQAAEKSEPIVRTIQTGYDPETGEAIYEREELDLSPLPFIVVIIDEMADLMMVAGKDIEGAIQRLAQMARAAGIHVIMATQRPSVDVITGTIKANFPTRISFQVTSKIDSRTILGEQGAEQLLGMGDMLYMAGGGRIQRVHGPFVSDEEVEDIVRHLKDQGIPQYLGAVTEEVDEESGDDPAQSGVQGGNLSDDADPYDQAVAIVLRDKKASTSYIQRRLGIGYNRAASIIERMEDEGIVGPANHAGKRDILVGSDPDEDFNYAD